MFDFHALTLAALLLVAAGPRAMFDDVTAGSGIPPLKYAEGVNITDLDGDGLPELFLPDVKGRDRLYKNLGWCRFRDVTDERGIKESGGIGAVAGDVNGDCLPDLYVVRGAYPYGLNVLYLQGPDGSFRDVTSEAGVESRKNGISAVMGDLDGDGRQDIFVSNWGVNTLFRNEGTGGMGGAERAVSFADVTDKSGLGGEGRGWSSVLGDFNGDGLPDMFVSRGGVGKVEDNRLYINRGKGSFEDLTEPSGIKGVAWSMGAVSCDFDGDGDLDLFVASYDGPDQLYVNGGNARFTCVTPGSGIGSARSVGAAAGDIDGDLLPDLVVAGFYGPVRVYKNLGGCRFKDVTKDAGLGPYEKNEGVALADLDGDGDLDLYVANYDGHNRLYRNNLGTGRYIKVRPVYGDCPAVGAKVRLYKAGGLREAGALLASQETQAGFGFCSQSPPEAIFRLPGDGPYDLSVTFPGGGTVEKRDAGPGLVVADGRKAAKEGVLTGSVVIKEELTIPEGDTLIVPAGTDLRFGEGVGVTVKGSLVVAGEPGRPVTIAPEEGASRWAGIMVDTKGSLKLANAAIKGAVEAVTTVGGAGRISNASIEDCDHGLIIKNMADVEVSGLKAVRINIAVVEITDQATVVMKDCSFTGPGAAGVVVAKRCAVTISGSSFSGMDTGILDTFQDTRPVVSGCAFTGNKYGAFLAAPGNGALFTGCQFTDNTYGLFIDRRAAPAVEGCEITGNEFGLFVTKGSSPSAKGSLITGNRYGVYVDNSSYPRVNGCDLSGNTLYAVYLDKQSADWMKEGNLSRRQQRMASTQSSEGGAPVDGQSPARDERTANPMGGYVDFRDNYWGTEAASEMASLKGQGDVSVIYDYFDNDTIVVEDSKFVRDKVDYSGFLMEDPLTRDGKKR